MSGYTNIYFTSELDVDTAARLSDYGVVRSTAKLFTTLIAPRASNAQIGRVPRVVDGLELLDFSFSVGGAYVASLGVLIDGRVFDSHMWYRYRTAAMDLLQWVGDRDRHEVIAAAGGTRYRFSVEGESSWLGYDDIAVTLGLAG